MIQQVLTAVAYLHANNIVHRDLKPENLLYLTPSHDSSLVLADFGIAKMLDTNDEVLTTMAGSFGYAAPEVMQKKGHGKKVDLWSLGVITYTLLCGYSPFRSEGLPELIEECSRGRVIFHEKYWKDVSKDAKSFIGALLQPKPEDRPSSAVGYLFLCLLCHCGWILTRCRRLLNTRGLRARLLPTMISSQRSSPTWLKRGFAAGLRW